MNKKIKIIITLVMIPFIIYFWPSSLGGDTNFLIVQGQSMLPTILPGSMVITKEAPQYEIDDIVAFEQREGRYSKLVVHRIIDDTNQGFAIQGDNNPRKDAGYYTNDDIIGKVFFATPYFGDAISMFRNPIFLVVAAVGVTALQTGQKRRKERMKKLRCLRLGIPYVPPKYRNPQKKAKKPDYSMFFGAIFFNALTFIVTQISIENNIRPEGDLITGFLYNGTIPTLANILIFAFYFVIIFGLYFLAKSNERKIQRSRPIQYLDKSYPQRILLRKKTNIMLSVASMGWLLYILMSIFNLMSMSQDLATIVT